MGLSCSPHVSLFIKRTETQNLLNHPHYVVENNNTPQSETYIVQKFGAQI